ncbi:MAG TPA: beta-ketoacyl synthase N-terminal-like domain-containing protein, partial [Bosea sp. (in: a-proteobacteria)]|nr:beta-ketoacyl synthase N-terminal-like domain-containing protein [Bosea sp. (in: a-proteobacteria)]
MSPTSAIVVSETAIVGAACRLPGAPDLAAFWELMQGERNSVSPRPVGRWNVERFLRPGKPSPGFTYTFAGGYIERPLAFDPAPFGLSPREVEQMDPQQRLLLRTVWRAFEDAGIAPSSVAGRNVGVYVGASVVDYQSAASHDPALMGSHFMTGNSLSILSNRISYVFDLKGPSFTVDSACSSSFIALTQAVTALEAGKIDMAIVAGVNLLLSPAPFIGFSQARMLSPTGACRPFSNDGDGYVRAEGAAAVLLQRHFDAASQKRRIRGVITAAGTNSDGWTNGIALPSFQAQQTLIEDMYAAAGVSAEDLAFVEAHGTGTKIGDPVEAMAIGRALGKRRGRPLPVGSVKSNIGHLEAASGLAGLLKSMLAFEHGVVPRSLFSDVPSESIDFADLNLELISAARPFEETVAGVCNYGFGGSNAHVILRKASSPVAEARPRPRLVSAKPGSEPRAPEVLLVSAASEDALKVRARQLADGLDSSLHVGELASALGHQAEWLPHRVAFPVPDDGLVASRILRDFADGISATGEVVHIRARQDDRPAIFVFSGNGSQYAAMGKIAYAASAAFRHEIAEIDKLCAEMVGWSVANRLRDGVSSDDLAQTSVAQPLIFAVQSALAAVLKGYGLRPAAVVGHSIGEIAAAEAAGILSREEALRVIHARSAHQQLTRGTGKMLVLAAQEQVVRAFIEERGYRTIDIAAINGPGSTTVAGSNEEIDALAVAARKNRMASVSLDVEYPFHSALLAPLHDNLVADLGSLTGRVGDIDFFSTVTGQRAAGSSINALYWADNMRQTVRFMPAIEAALETYPDAAFVEIGARPILGSVVNDILRKHQKTNPVLATLSAQETASGDPVRFVAASLVAHGVRHDHAAVFGDRVAGPTFLPPYPFQDEDFYLGETSEAIGVYGRPMASSSLHPLLGTRMAQGSPEWRYLLDTTLLPYLKDHVVNGAVIAPATAFVEMALAVADALHPGARLELDEFDILRPLTFGEDETHEISIRYANRTETIEIWSRKRLSGKDWLPHARGVIRALPLSEAPQDELPRPVSPRLSTAQEVYAAAERAGLSYGRAFQLVTSGIWDETVGHSVLKPARGGTGAFASDHILHPVSFDAAFHGLLLARRQRDGERKAYLPIRFRKIRVWRPRQPVLRAVTELVRETDRFKSVRVFLLGEGDDVVASVDAAVFRAVHLIKPFVAERTFRETQIPVAPAPVRLSEALAAEGPASSDWRDAAHVRLLLKATAIGLAQRLFSESAAVADTVPQWLMQAAEELLETAGALEGGAEGRVLSTSFSVPAPEAVLATICARFPQANTEIQLVSQALAGVDALLAPSVPAQASATRPRQSWWASSLQARQAAETIAVQVAQIAADRPGLRILVTGEAGPILAGAITDVLDPGIANLTVLLDATNLPDPALQAGERANRFDLLVGLYGSEPLSDGATGLAALVGQLGPDAAILIGAADVDGNTAFLQAAGMPAAELALPPTFREWLMAANVVDLSGEGLVDAAVTLYRGRAPKRPTAANTRSRVLLLSIVEAPVSPGTLGLKAADVIEASASEELDAWLAAGSDEDSAILLPLAIKDCDSAVLAARLDLLIALLYRLGEARRTLLFMVVTMPEAAGEDAGASLAVRAAIAGFVRVAINEFPDLDLRLVDVEAADLASRMVDIVGDPGGERDWRICREGICVNRMRRGMVEDVALDRDERAVLHFGESGSLSGFEWRKEPREAPAEGEVEVEVAASSLNYRDLLVALGVLDDDLLGAGLTRAALGFECSGTIVRVGAGVTTLSPGDRVMGFAAGTFASHLVCPASHMFPVPQGMTLEAAATIPVAFATAWYALVEQGRIKAGETVLIHGGAGGVGLAAIQIAKLKQAEILATARGGARQALALAAGAGHAFESRNESFEQAVRDRFGGVDLVLNSLAGAAMLASFRLLKPFGRFLELGKRDYL